MFLVFQSPFVVGYFFLDILNGETKNGRVLNLRHSVFSKVGAIKTLGNLCSSLEATMGKI